MIVSRDARGCVTSTFGVGVGGFGSARVTTSLKMPSASPLTRETVAPLITSTWNSSEPADGTGQISAAIRAATTAAAEPPTIGSVVVTMNLRLPVYREERVLARAVK
jgi:hypothetical protein